MKKFKNCQTRLENNLKQFDTSDLNSNKYKKLDLAKPNVFDDNIEI